MSFVQEAHELQSRGDSSEISCLRTLVQMATAEVGVIQQDAPF